VKWDTDKEIQESKGICSYQIIWKSSE